MTTLKIFVSHSMREDDMEILKTLNEKLSPEIEPIVAEWKPSPGRLLTEKIKGDLLSCDAVLAILTKNGARSQWVNQEIGFAVAKGKPVIPMREKGVDVQGFVQGLEWINLDTKKPHIAMKKLNLHLERMLGHKEEIIHKGKETHMWMAVALGIIAIVAIIFAGIALAKSR